MSRSYETIEAAVFNAALAAREKYGNQSEAMSLVYEKDGKFYFTEPLAQGVKKGHSVKVTVQIPKGGLRYIVHNHPDGHDNNLFSTNDIKMAEKFGVPSAIIFGAEPTIRTFTPGRTATEFIKRPASRQPLRVSRGDEFGIAEMLADAGSDTAAGDHPPPGGTRGPVGAGAGAAAGLAREIALARVAGLLSPSFGRRP